MNKMILALVLSMSATSYAAPEVCQLKFNGQELWSGTVTDGDGQGFYAAVAQASQQNGMCLYAKIDQVPNSGRVYFQGRLQSDYSNKKKNLSNREAKEAMSQTHAPCQTVSCIPLVYDQKPQYEQPYQYPTYPQQVPTYPESSNSSQE